MAARDERLPRGGSCGLPAFGMPDAAGELVSLQVAQVAAAEVVAVFDGVRGVHCLNEFGDVQRLVERAKQRQQLVAAATGRQWHLR